MKHFLKVKFPSFRYHLKSEHMLFSVTSLNFFQDFLWTKKKSCLFTEIFLYHCKINPSECYLCPRSWINTPLWKIPWMEEPGGLQSMGSLRVRHNFTFTFHFHALEKEMATHSTVLAWRIPGMEEPGGLPSMGSHRVGHDWSDLATAAWMNERAPLDSLLTRQVTSLRLQE